MGATDKVRIGSYDGAVLIDATGESPPSWKVAGTRGIERRHGAVLVPHKAMRAFRVRIIARDGAVRIDAPSTGGPCPRDIHRGHGAVLVAQIAVIAALRVNVVSRDGAVIIDAQGGGTLEESCAGTW